MRSSGKNLEDRCSHGVPRREDPAWPPFQGHPVHDPVSGIGEPFAVGKAKPMPVENLTKEG